MKEVEENKEQLEEEKRKLAEELSKKNNELDESKAALERERAAAARRKKDLEVSERVCESERALSSFPMLSRLLGDSCRS